jgi:hypothetical protein
MTPTELSNLEHAIFDVIEQGHFEHDPKWYLYAVDNAFATEQRNNFVNAVLRRMRAMEGQALLLRQRQGKNGNEQYTRNPSMASTGSLQDG